MNSLKLTESVLLAARRIVGCAVYGIGVAAAASPGERMEGDQDDRGYDARGGGERVRTLLYPDLVSFEFVK